MGDQAHDEDEPQPPLGENLAHAGERRRERLGPALMVGVARRRVAHDEPDQRAGACGGHGVVPEKASPPPGYQAGRGLSMGVVAACVPLAPAGHRRRCRP